MSTDNYVIDHRNKVKRVPKRGFYDKETVYKILDDGCVCHLSFVMDGQPFVIPTLYGRHENKLYFHGAASSRLIKNLEQGVEVCLAVTHIDGLVLARSAFHHSMNYRSVVVFGKAKLVADSGKNEALKVISDHIIPDRWEEVRQPTGKELKATAVLELTIDQASAKIREGGPVDDEPDYILDIWAGVIPMKHLFQAPIVDEKMTKELHIPNSVKNLLDSQERA
ncbi:pyridoxamine 5'-phosphate oxidase family protein [Fulvivirga lutea]|uniref:Pyridoxamine 5'-phosphate oxidase family protein n=1 Tax=Fulvivirga lutea TaxID=2810512 RepID=A0A975A257_9BACT|nr:pyridoxamine 5'-phosphate oxidase family protein [Fulvivirga lutea]QSE98935.1 pyridoxamine 5'-phosphate oxidase family protein [Fulvivirga lutea]